MKSQKSKTMKHITILTALVLFMFNAQAQENIITVSGGYSFANMDEVDAQLTGYRINGLYEFNPNEGPLAHGLSFGYLNISTDYSVDADNIITNTNVKVSSWPVYYAPKYMFGENKFKGFVKGAVGIHFSKYTTETTIGGNGPSTLEVGQNGFYGGVGAGLIFNINEKLFINAEYEIAYMGNYYVEAAGWLNTAMGGIGIKF